MRRILVTGASGDLGGPLVRLAARTAAVTALYYSRPERVPAGRAIRVDLLDPHETRNAIEAARPDVIMHAAVSERGGGVERIVPAAESVAAAAQAVGSRLLFLSTDLIFDGKHPPYTEDAPPIPVLTYGQAKARAESIISGLVADLVIVRTSLIYDFTAANHQVGWMVEKIARGEVIGLFTDEIRQPIWAFNLAEALLELADLPYAGILHIAGPARLSRWDYGRALLAAMGLAERAKVAPVRAAEVAPGRPPDVSLDLSRAGRVLTTRLLRLDEAQAAARSPDYPAA